MQGYDTKRKWNEMGEDVWAHVKKQWNAKEDMWDMMVGLATREIGIQDEYAAMTMPRSKNRMSVIMSQKDVIRQEKEALHANLLKYVRSLQGTEVEREHYCSECRVQLTSPNNR